MEAKRTYNECELRYFEQGYDSAGAARECGGAESRPAEKPKDEASQETDPVKFWEDF
jgi:hypothetical protein